VVRIVLDAMGGDGAPHVEVQGALDALERDDDLSVVLAGDAAEIEAALAGRASDEDRLSVLPAVQQISMDEAPASAVRRKPDSSIVVGMEEVGRGTADAFVSAGSTGAIMAASVLVLGPLPGVDRPAVGVVVPTVSDPIFVLDVGANVDSQAFHLHQFAHLGAIYARDVLDRPDPSVGLLNVGEEAEKGDEVSVEAYGRLEADSGLRFVGNVEGDDILGGACDVLVCDGFAGNVFLKFYESVAGFVRGWLEEAGASKASIPALDELFRVLDYAEYGGAPLLGVGGVTVICHGDSTARAVRNALGVASESVRAGMLDTLGRDLEKLSRRTGARRTE
jgi:glycerol-3-phosphate acyltransferase PlsX